MNLGILDVSPSLTATGTTQGTALELINGIAFVGTVPSGTGVALNPNATPGTPQIAYNGGANGLNVYPPSGYKINNLAVNSSHVLATNTACQYWFVSSTQIIGILSA